MNRNFMNRNTCSFGNSSVRRAGVFGVNRVVKRRPRKTTKVKEEVKEEVHIPEVEVVPEISGLKLNLLRLKNKSDAKRKDPAARLRRSMKK